MSEQRDREEYNAQRAAEDDEYERQRAQDVEALSARVVEAAEEVEHYEKALDPYNNRHLSEPRGARRCAMPADARTIAEEALRLAEGATPGPWNVSNSFDIECDTCGEHPYVCDLTAEHEDGTAYQSLSMQFCGLESLAAPNAALVAHAGTHYATLARAYLALVSDLPVVIEAADRPNEHMPECAATYVESTLVVPCDCAHRVRAAIERLRALGGG